MWLILARAERTERRTVYAACQHIKSTGGGDDDDMHATLASWHTRLNIYFTTYAPRDGHHAWMKNNQVVVCPKRIGEHVRPVESGIRRCLSLLIYNTCVVAGVSNWGEGGSAEYGGCGRPCRYHPPRRLFNQMFDNNQGVAACAEIRSCQVKFYRLDESGSLQTNAPILDPVRMCEVADVLSPPHRIHMVRWWRVVAVATWATLLLCCCL